MKKLLSSIIVVILLTVILLGFSSWYLGVKAEKSFKAYLQQSSQLAGQKFLRAELLSYKKNLIGAKAKLQISSDFPLIAERIGEFQLDVKLFNGPFFISKSGLGFGSSRWLINLDESANKNIAELFPKVLPNSVVRIDFDNKANYSARLKTVFAESLVTGIYNLETQDNRGAISIRQFNLGNQPNTISAKKIKLSYQHQKAITTSYKPGTASIHIPSLKITHKKLQKPFFLDLKINSNISIKNNNLSGFIKANIKNKLSKNQPFETGKLTLLFNGLSADSFVAFTEAYADLENLHQQAQWALEELGELPEGQDQIWKLYDEIEESSQQLPQALAKLGKQSLIQLKATMQNQGENSQLTGKIKLEKNSHNIKSWLSLLDGEANVTLDKHLHTFLKKYLPLKQQFVLKLKNDKLLMMQ